MARGLYEGRERPSKTYSWHVFLMSNIVVELPWACEYRSYYRLFMLDADDTSPDGHCHVLLLVLPHWRIQQRCANKRSRCSRRHGVALLRAIPPLRFHLRLPVRGRHGFVRDRQ